MGWPIVVSLLNPVSILYIHGSPITADYRYIVVYNYIINLYKHALPIYNSLYLNGCLHYVSIYISMHRQSTTAYSYKVVYMMYL